MTRTEAKTADFGRPLRRVAVPDLREIELAETTFAEYEITSDNGHVTPLGCLHFRPIQTVAPLAAD